MRAPLIGPVAVLALGALALWWLYRRGQRTRLQGLAAAPLSLPAEAFEPPTIDPGPLRMPQIVLH